MNNIDRHLRPEAPFVWPEPRVLEEISSYEIEPPFDALARASDSVFGIVSALSGKGIDLLESWLKDNAEFQVRLVVAVYPTCQTRQHDLSHLLAASERYAERLTIRLRPHRWVTDRPANALCFVQRTSGIAQMVTGPTENLGFDSRRDGKVNFVFRAEAPLAESFGRYFNWLWARSTDISAEGVIRIPNLLLPEGTVEGDRLWRDYFSSCFDDPHAEDSPGEVAKVDPESGDVTIVSESGERITPPTEESGLPKLDRLAEAVARLYEKGVLVSIDKLSRMPPLDVPLEPGWFGDSSELHKGNVIRRVSMRVSVIDKKTLKEIDKRRQALRTLLSKFSFGLADNMRWMPAAARTLFESEVKRVNEEGQELISKLLEKGVEQFIDAKKPALVADINAMYAELGRPGQVTEDIILRVVEMLKERLGKGQSGNFMPKLSYSSVNFARTENAAVSPWGQAFSILSDVAAFPRKALTDSFFFRGLKVKEDDVIEAMNVADDALYRNLGARGIKDRCKAELELLSRIEKAPMEARDRCELVWQILTGNSTEPIHNALREKEAL